VYFRGIVSPSLKPELLNWILIDTSLSVSTSDVDDAQPAPIKIDMDTNIHIQYRSIIMISYQSPENPLDNQPYISHKSKIMTAKSTQTIYCSMSIP
jgi:hypothetical protein